MWGFWHSNSINGSLRDTEMQLTCISQKKHLKCIQLKLEKVNTGAKWCKHEYTSSFNCPDWSNLAPLRPLATLCQASHSMSYHPSPWNMPRCILWWALWAHSWVVCILMLGHPECQITHRFLGQNAYVCYTQQPLLCFWPEAFILQQPTLGYLPKKTHEFTKKMLLKNEQTHRFFPCGRQQKTGQNLTGFSWVFQLHQVVSAAQMESTTKDSCPGDSRNNTIYTSDC